MVLMGYSRVRGKLTYEKNLKLKISCQTPINGADILYSVILHWCVRKFFIEPPPDTQRKERQGERGIWVAMSCYLFQATPPTSPSPHRASVAPPAATLSGLAEGRPPPPTYSPLLFLISFQQPRPICKGGLYSGAQKCCSWIWTAFVIMYEFSVQW